MIFDDDREDLCMTMYRKFGQGMAVLCCVAMFILAIVYVFVNGFSNVNEESGEIIYFYEYINFQSSLLIALSFLVSAVANGCAGEFPQIATGISVLPLVMTFYEMAIGNMNFVAAAVILLLSLIHFASNAIEWYDMWQAKKKAKEEASQKAAQETAQEPAQ